jgi:hypothetical protein
MVCYFFISFKVHVYSDFASIFCRNPFYVVIVTCFCFKTFYNFCVWSCINTHICLDGSDICTRTRLWDVFVAILNLLWMIMTWPKSITIVKENTQTQLLEPFPYFCHTSKCIYDPGVDVCAFTYLMAVMIILLDNICS